MNGALLRILSYFSRPPACRRPVRHQARRGRHLAAMPVRLTKSIATPRSFSSKTSSSSSTPLQASVPAP